jgi:hypothetical protein
LKKDRDATEAELDIKVPILPGRKEWWNIKWNTIAKVRRYFDIFEAEVCTKYIGKIQKKMDEHLSECHQRNQDIRTKKCWGQSHWPFLKDLYFRGVSLQRIWDQHCDDRNAAIEQFKPVTKGKQRIIAPPLPPEEKAAYDKMVATGAFPRKGVLDMFPSLRKRLKDWHNIYPNQRRGSTDKISGYLNPQVLRRGQPVEDRSTGRFARIYENSPYTQAWADIVYDDDLAKRDWELPPTREVGEAEGIIHRAEKSDLWPTDSKWSPM